MRFEDEFWGENLCPLLERFFQRFVARKLGDVMLKRVEEPKIDLDGSALVTRGNEQQRDRRGGKSF